MGFVSNGAFPIYSYHSDLEPDDDAITNSFLSPLSLTWFNLNPSMDNYIHYKEWDEITYPFPPLKFGNG